MMVVVCSLSLNNIRRWPKDNNRVDNRIYNLHVCTVKHKGKDNEVETEREKLFTGNYEECVERWQKEQPKGKAEKGKKAPPTPTEKKYGEGAHLRFSLVDTVFKEAA